jgi:hypothetical protein
MLLRHLPVWALGAPAIAPPLLMVLSRRGPAGRPVPSAPPLLLRTTGFVHPTLFTLRRPLHLLCLLPHCLCLLHLLPRLLW